MFSIRSVMKLQLCNFGNNEDCCYYVDFIKYVLNFLFDRSFVFQQHYLIRHLSQRTSLATYRVVVYFRPVRKS